MKRVISLVLIILLIACLSMLLYNNINVVVANISKNNSVGINTLHKVKEFVSDMVVDSVINKDEEIYFDSLGTKTITIKYKNGFGVLKNKKVKVQVVDEENPIINFKKELIVEEDSNVDILKDITVVDNSQETIKPILIGNYNIEKVGTYKMQLNAEDSSGNKTTEEFNLVVEEKKIIPSPDAYYVILNKTQNTLMIYYKDKNGEYTKLRRVFVVSAGNATPVGVFTTSTKTEVISFSGGAYGRYATRIYKSIWFHSVPYNGRPAKGGDWNMLSYKEYNKLGDLASHGCVRLAVKDAKWIYENIAPGTTIEIIESDSLPEGVTKPAAIKIDVDSSSRGWDPTDPSPKNPWNNDID